MWKVGDGSHIKIWGDKWIISTYSHLIQALVRIFDEDARVTEIINQEANWWNVPLIEHIFPAEIVEQICSMPSNAV